MMKPHDVQNNRFLRVTLAVLVITAMMVMLSACGEHDYSVSGTIASGGSGLSGVTVTLAGSSSGTTITNTGGKYKFSDLSEGTYTVTPSLPGFVFIPLSRTANLVDGVDANGFDFSVMSLGRVATATHSVFLENDGTVWTWGENGNGQLGIGSTMQQTIPVQIRGLSGITAVSAGNDFTLALKGDGTVWAWGTNVNGQLGDGSTSQRTAPVQVAGLAGMTIVAVAAGVDHSVALRNDGTVWSWGANNKGQLGDGTTAGSAAPVQVRGLSGVTAISAGFGYTLALLSDNTVRAWGNNHNGQLGNGATTDSLSPVQVSGLSGVLAVSAGHDHAAVLKSEGNAIVVDTWGKNASGQLGNGTMTDSAIPVEVSGLSHVAAVAAGFDHTIVVNDDGAVWAWGSNSNGQLGANKAMLAGSASPVQVSGLSDVIAVAAGVGDAIALKNDGTLQAWGNNSNGQLGNGTVTDSAIPVPVTL